MYTGVVEAMPVYIFVWINNLTLRIFFVPLHSISLVKRT